MKNKLISVLAVIALTAQLAGCSNSNSSVEQTSGSSTAVDVSDPQSGSLTSTAVSSSSKPQSSSSAISSSTVSSISSSTTSSTSITSETSEPQSSAVSTTSEPEISSSSSQTVETPTPQWTETPASGTYYVNTACASRGKAIQGSDVVKQYKLNDKVTVTAKTDTGYYKLADGEFIHGDYLSTSEVVVQQPSTPSGGSGNSGNSSTAVKPFTGEKLKPSEGVTQIGEEERGVGKDNYETFGYWVEAPGGKYWFCETNGRYYRSMEDRLNGKRPVNNLEVFQIDPSIGNDIHLS